MNKLVASQSVAREAVPKNNPLTCNVLSGPSIEEIAKELGSAVETKANRAGYVRKATRLWGAGQKRALTVAACMEPESSLPKLLEQCFLQHQDSEIQHMWHRRNGALARRQYKNKLTSQAGLKSTMAAHTKQDEYWHKLLHLDKGGPSLLHWRVVLAGGADIARPKVGHLKARTPVPARWAQHQDQWAAHPQAR